MLTPDIKIPIPAVDLKQALTDIIDSIAVDHTAFGHILEAESEMLNRAKNEAYDVDQFTSFNASVNSIVRSFATIQLITHYELEDAENLLQKIAELSEYDDLEE